MDTATDGSSALAIAPREASLFGKMARVMGIINRVPKSGFNTFHKYKYATTDDVADVIREAMSEVNLALLVEMGEPKQETIDGDNGKKMIRTTIRFIFTFACGDTGAVISKSWTGQVDDNSDKAINKCATAAEKYFLMKTFIVSAGDEPDSDADKHREEAGQKVAPPQKILEWHEKPGVIHEMVNRAFKNEWVTENGALGQKQLEKLIAPAVWSDFPDANKAGLAIMEAVEKQKKPAPVETKTLDAFQTAALQQIVSDQAVKTAAAEISRDQAKASLNHQTGSSTRKPADALPMSPEELALAEKELAALE